MILSRFQGTFRAVSHIPPSTSEFGGCTAKELFPPAKEPPLVDVSDPRVMGIFHSRHCFCA